MKKMKSLLGGTVFVGVVVGLLGCAALTPSAKTDQKARLYLQMGVDSLQRREYSKAIEATHKALKLDPENAAAYNHLALIYMETRRYKKSEKAFKKALSKRKNYPEVYNNLGVLKNRQGRYAAAIRHFRKALEYEKYTTPENPLTNMGYSFYKLGKMSRAKRQHQKALDIVPQFCLAHKNMGDVYAKEKHYGKARDYYQNAVTHCPLYQEAHYKMSLALMKMGQRKVARAELEKLVDQHKQGHYVRRSNEVLKYLK